MSIRKAELRRRAVTSWPRVEALITRAFGIRGSFHSTAGFQGAACRLRHLARQLHYYEFCQPVAVKLAAMDADSKVMSAFQDS